MPILLRNFVIQVLCSAQLNIARACDVVWHPADGLQRLHERRLSITLTGYDLSKHGQEIKSASMLRGLCFQRGYMQHGAMCVLLAGGLKRLHLGRPWPEQIELTLHSCIHRRLLARCNLLSQQRLAASVESRSRSSNQVQSLLHSCTPRLRKKSMHAHLS